MAKYNSKGWHFQTVRHSNARKYGRAGGTYSNTRLKNLDISGKYYSMRWKSDGKQDLSLSLGNLSDAGWYWNGSKENLIGFIQRLSSSKTREEFLKDINNSGVEYDDLKPLLIKSAEKADGLYEITGDNARWKFGEEFDSESTKQYIEDDFTEQLERAGIRIGKDNKEKILQEATDYAFDKADYKGMTFDDYATKKTKKEYSEQIKKIINKSKNFNELMDELQEIKDDWYQDAWEHLDNVNSGAETNAYNQWWRDPETIKKHPELQSVISKTKLLEAGYAEEQKKLVE